jgi:hypothetical protein
MSSFDSPRPAKHLRSYLADDIVPQLHSARQLQHFQQLLRTHINDAIDKRLQEEPAVSTAVSSS